MNSAAQWHKATAGWCVHFSCQPHLASFIAGQQGCVVVLRKFLLEPVLHSASVPTTSSMAACAACMKFQVYVRQ